MSEEPTYTYVKGQGWVAGFQPEYPTLIQNIGRYRVTLTDREPLNGESFFTQSTYGDNRKPLELLGAALLVPYWQDKFTRFTSDELARSLPVWSRNYDYALETRGRTRVIVVGFEPL